MQGKVETPVPMKFRNALFLGSRITETASRPIEMKKCNTCLDGVKVLYIGNFRFPEGDVAATRVLAIGKALRDAGAVVMFAGGETAGREADAKADGKYVYQGFNYVSMDEFRTKALSPVKRLIRYFVAGRNTARWLQSLDPKSVDVVIIYNPFAGLLCRILPICRQRKIPMVVDCTEWHDAAHYPGGRFGLHRWDVEWTMRSLIPRAGHVLAISSYLERFYQAKHVPVMRVPPLVDLKDTRFEVQTSTPGKELPLIVMYAGSPAKKDCMEQILEACCLAKRQGLPIRLEIAGMDPIHLDEAGSNAARCVQELGDDLVVYGRFPTSRQAVQKMAAADLLLLVKYPSRSAEAQFPTKLVEYMALGRPVLANNTSDVAQYMRDGIEGFLISDHQPESIRAGLQRAVEARVQLKNMGEASREAAEKYFDYKLYSASLQDFVRQALCRTM